MYEDSVLGLQNSANAGMQVQRTRFLSKVITDESLKGHLKDSIKDLEDAIAKEKKTFDDYEKTIVAQEDRKLFNEASKLREVNDVILQKTIELVRQGKFKEANALVNNNQEMSKNYATSITSVIDWNAQNGKKLKEEADDVAHSAILEIVTTSILVFLFGLIAVYFIVRQIEVSLRKIQIGLRGFFAFLNRDIDKVALIDINRDDEFGIIAREINENIQKVETQINLDNRLVEEAKHTIVRVQHGWYSEHIQSTTTNKSLEEFKNGVNAMIKATKEHFVSMNVILEQYASYDYTKELKLDNIEKGGVFEILVTDINKLRDAVTKMLKNSLQNGLELQGEAGNLKQAVEALSTASNQQAASLEETAAAMEEMTSNVQNNAQKANDMAVMAAQTDASAKEGAELAGRTANAMNEIQHATSSINDAVAIIENIAFQTNILSLNAAVEAATAGDAGKGFAVVAQEVRNLANRSADAAKEIKTLAAQASEKSNEGTAIATELTRGFEIIADKIAQTTILVQDVSNASREQMQGIGQINTAVTQLDQMTQENAKIAAQADTIADATIEKAQGMVADTLQMNFIGKSKVA
jgi:methyl-accepting chemotaxis protein